MLFTIGLAASATVADGGQAETGRDDPADPMHHDRHRIKRSPVDRFHGHDAYGQAEQNG